MCVLANSSVSDGGEQPGDAGDDCPDYAKGVQLTTTIYHCYYECDYKYQRSKPGK